MKNVKIHSTFETTDGVKFQTQYKAIQHQNEIDEEVFFRINSVVIEKLLSYNGYGPTRPERARWWKYLLHGTTMRGSGTQWVGVSESDFKNWIFENRNNFLELTNI